MDDISIQDTLVKMGDIAVKEKVVTGEEINSSTLSEIEETFHVGANKKTKHQRSTKGKKKQQYGRSCLQ